MIPAWIIEEIRKEEREREERRAPKYLPLEMPLEPPPPWLEDEASPPPSDRGVVVIDIL